jgi:L-alanine-DL-glutamate epimerase-like enolase superfamily enzyme
VLEPESAWQAMAIGPVGRPGGCGIGRSRIDIALWDAAGRLGQPLWRLLGGFRDGLPAYASDRLYGLSLPGWQSAPPRQGRLPRHQLRLGASPGGRCRPACGWQEGARPGVEV